MDCPYCNNPLPPNVNQCPSCGAAVRQQPAQPQYAPPPQQQYAPPPPPYAPQYAPPVMSTKSRTVYVLLAIFLGGLGIHNFYAGRTGSGIAQLLITLISCGYGSFITWLWAIIEACAVTTDGQGRRFC